MLASMLLPPDIGHRLQVALDQAEACGAMEAARFLRVEVTPLIAEIRRLRAQEPEASPSRSHA